MAKNKPVNGQEYLLAKAPEQASIASGNNWQTSLIKKEGKATVQSEKQSNVFGAYPESWQAAADDYELSEDVI
tara:strand:- start:745 stop:963 length:219 start_codon:yes stop_codon:yes gene_type:complete